MLVQDLEGNIDKWKIVGYLIGTDQTNRSSLHIKVRELLLNKYSTLSILEEVPISIKTNHTLYLDFYIPLLNKAVEVQGSQHYKFNTYFHKNVSVFIKQKRNDRLKREWCGLNNILLIEFAYNETISDWEGKL